MKKNNQIKGGKADNMSIEDIARKHSMFVGTIKKELEMGMKVEKEHTNDEAKAKEIVMDHLFEFPDYYTRLHKMEKQGEKSLEAKESMGADCSGSYEAPFTGTILKKDIHKLHNWKTKQKEVKEQMDAGVSAGAMYDGPIGTAGPSSPMDKTKKKRKDPLKIDNAESKMGGASITGASTKDMIATKKGFPRFGGPEGKFVEIDNKCKTFPYCDQGASSDKAFGKSSPIKLTEEYALKFFESKQVQEAIQEAAKKYGIPVKNVQKMVLGDLISEALPRGMFDDSNLRALKGWTDKGSKIKYKLTTKEPLELIMDDDIEIAKIKLIFYKHDVDFNVEKLKE